MKKATKILIILGAVLFVLVEAGALFAMYRLGQSTARPAIPADAMIFSGELLEVSGGPETSRTVLLIDNGQDGYIQAVHLQEDTVILGEDGAPTGVESLIPGQALKLCVSDTVNSVEEKTESGDQVESFPRCYEVRMLT